MKTFKQHLQEAKIRVGSNRGTNVKSFLDDYYNTTTEHPINDRARILGKTMVQLSPSQGDIHLHSIQTLAPKTGAGSEAIQHLTSLATKHGVNITLNAAVFGNDPRHIPTNKELAEWYEKRGFEKVSGNKADGYGMIYRRKHP